MGMFDWVNFECDCPNCGEKLDDFQSKSGECIMITVEPETVSNWYTSCLNCHHWIEYGWPPPENKTPILLKNESLEKRYE